MRCSADLSKIIRIRSTEHGLEMQELRRKIATIANMTCGIFEVQMM
jgi:hypothetical protein